jgi:hypothetical protein
MNIKELRLKLEDLKIPKRYYSLKKELFPDRFYLVKEDNGIWEFYYLDERGGKNEYKSFAFEENACKYFYKKIIEMEYEWRKNY